MSARGWAFPRNARTACYFALVPGLFVVSSLCGRKTLFNGATVNDKYAGSDRCRACEKKLDKLEREQAERDQ